MCVTILVTSKTTIVCKFHPWKTWDEKVWDVLSIDKKINIFFAV